MTVVALIGSLALYLLFAWLTSAIVASYLSDRKGFGEKVGLASGMLAPVIAPLVWLVWPAKSASKWKLNGPFGSGGKTVAEARAEATADQAAGSPPTA